MTNSILMELFVPLAFAAFVNWYKLIFTETKHRTVKHMNAIGAIPSPQLQKDKKIFDWFQANGI